MSVLKRLRLLVLALLAWLAAAVPALAAPPFWVVEDGDTTIYLFGTMHILQPDAEWRTEAFDKAYASAQEVWFETDATPSQEDLTGLMLRLGMDLERPLQGKLKPETWAAISKALEGKPYKPEMLNTMRPWAAAMMLSVLPMIEAGFEAEAGADASLEREAKGAEKRVFAFETPEQQLRFFADLPEAIEVQFLEDTVEALSMTEDDSEAMQQAWIDGDLSVLGPLMLDSMRKDRPELYQVLIKGRNPAWVEVLADRMSRPGVVMVNVGALHMVGPDGLPDMLAARGFKVRRVQ